uniref:Hepcidin n=1 Tax=Gopherus evgoodei TaxID=1825980 RepID=A0A8C4WRK4_9SAUR
LSPGSQGWPRCPNMALGGAVLQGAGWGYPLGVGLGPMSQPGTRGRCALLRRAKRHNTHFPICTFCCKCCRNQGCGFCCRT